MAYVIRHWSISPAWCYALATLRRLAGRFDLHKHRAIRWRRPEVEMKLTPIILLTAFTILTGCDSPEAKRTRGGGPGADVGNHDPVVEMHEGSLPFWKTPQIIATRHAPIASADQADRLSRR